MTSESKILTVSYGTFSCTLEGFDNPFDTMKAIAEYFRELAAQDRHFGAEPPPPDAAMLHRIAEREVSRMAGAAARDDAALLNTDVTETALADGAGPRIQMNAPSRRRVSREAAADVFPADDEIASHEPSLQDVIPDGVAAKLARIRQAVSPAPTTLAASFAPFTAAAEPVEDASVEADAVEEDAVEEDAAIAADFEALDLTAEGAKDVAEDLLVDEFAAVEMPDGDAEIADEADIGEDDAVLEVHLGESWSEAGVTEEVTVAEEDSAAASDDPIAAAPTEALISLDAEDLLSAEDDIASEDLAKHAELDGLDFDAASLEAALDDTLPEDFSAEIALSDPEIEDFLPEAETAQEGTTDVNPEPIPEPIAEVDVALEEPGKTRTRTRRIYSRVVRLHPEVIEQEPESARNAGATRVISSNEQSDEIARLMQQAEEVMAEEENLRRQEALSHLKAAVVSTEADRADVDYEAPKADTNLDPYRDDLAEAIEPEAIEPEASPEVRPRRKSVSVRPQEPRPGTIRPGMISPPPLVLVSEQRIDRVAPSSAPVVAPSVPGIGPAIPVGQPMVASRTGRLSGAIGSGAAHGSAGMAARNLILEKPSYGLAVDAEEDEDLAEDTKEIDESGLAAFAEIVGAKSMPDLLEAAAAYATCVENRSQFTRPQLMRRMMACAGGNAVSREDGLRSFGTLLRTGRIEKINRGHYSLVETSPYLAEARRLT